MPLDLMPPCYQQVLTSHLEKREAAKVAGAKHKGNVGPAPALGWEEVGEPDGRLYEQATGGAETPRGALGPPQNFHWTKVPKRIFLVIKYIISETWLGIFSRNKGSCLFLFY